jgi:predicted membrane protein
MKAKSKNLILAIVVSIVAIFIPSFLFDKWFEGIIFFVCHWLIREQFPKQYHHIVPSICRTITSTIFFFGVSFILPFSLSLLSAIPINYLIGWVGFTKKQADDYETKYERLKAELDKKNEFNTDTCTREQLIKRCEELHFSQDKIDLAIEFFIEKTKQSEIAEELCIEEKSVTRKKFRMKQELNNKD